jgi:1,2-diacylglycerol 3-alpha-glucosyltransferase
MNASKQPEKLSLCIVARHFPLDFRGSSILAQIALGLTKLNVDVRILTLPGRTPEMKFALQQPLIKQGVRIYFVDSPKPISFLHRFLELNREQKVSLVHGMDSSVVEIAKQKSQLGFKLACDVESTQMGQLFSILGMKQDRLSSLFSNGISLAYNFLRSYFGGDRELLVHCDGVFVSTPQQRLFLERYYLYPDLKIHSVPYGVDFEHTPQPIPRSEFLTAHGLPENAQIVVSLLDMSDQMLAKNIITAFEKLAIKKPNCYLALLGSGPEWKKIEYDVFSHALGSKVLMPGAVTEDETSTWISHAQVYLNLNSNSTGFEPETLEALVQRKILIGSEVSAIAHVIEDGKDGFLIRPADSESLSKMLIEIFSGSISTETIGENARHKVQNIFEPQKMLRALQNAYASL